MFTEDRKFTIGEREMVLIPRTIRHYTMTASERSAVKVYGLVAERREFDGGTDVFSRLSPLLADSAVRVFSDAHFFLPMLEEYEKNRMIRTPVF